MPTTRCLALLLLSLSSLSAWALEPADARQLLVRTGFQPSAAEIRALSTQSPDQAVDALVATAKARTTATTPLPAWSQQPASEFSLNKLPREQRRERQQLLSRQAVELQSWWITEMTTTPAPLTERMTLFWHDHFTSEITKVQYPQLMLRQNQLLRRHALGNFGELLRQVSRDPAMLIYLDGGRNRRGEPNENYARELMELFTLGEGQYSEQDIREAARALTGWSVDPDTGAARFYPKRHDDGEKTVFGKTARFDTDGLIDLILQQPATAEYLVRKLWLEFVSPEPDPQAVRRLAAEFRRDYEIAPLLKALLKQDALLRANNRGTLVKSPVELTVGLQRSLGLDAPPELAVLASSTMGQTLFNPPNVKGWPQGTDWLTTESYLARRQYLSYVLGDARRMADAKHFRGAPNQLYKAIAPRQRAIGQQIAAVAEAMPLPQLQPVVLNLEPVIEVEDGAKPPEQLASWLLDPVYQLK